MPISRDTLCKRAVKAGVKASKKRDRVISPDELLSLRVQVMPAAPRVLLVLTGIALIACCWSGWPSESNVVQAIEVLTGLLAILFGLFGIRRTLAHVLDSMDAIEFAGSILEMVAEAVSGIVDL